MVGILQPVKASGVRVVTYFAGSSARAVQGELAYFHCV
jgi:hypothetical protein